MAIVSASCGKYSEQTAPENFEVRITSTNLDAHLAPHPRSFCLVV